MNRMRWTLTLWAILLLGLSACNSSTSKSDNAPQGPLNVVATTGMIADLVQNIGGDSVEVISLMGPGVDPHLYKATQGDLKSLQRADLVLYNGLHLEGKMGEILEKLGRIQPVVAIAEGIEPAKYKEDEAFQGNYDPHLWNDVILWSSAIPHVLDAMIKESPKDSAYFTENARAFQIRLTDLHLWTTQQMDSIPDDQRIMITAHDAFSYLGRAYNIEVRGLQGLSTISEFGLRDRVELVDFIVERGIKAIFVETSVSEKNVNAIVESCHEKGHQLVIGGSLFSDAMGNPGTPEGTYEGMIRSNINTIVNALR